MDCAQFEQIVHDIERPGTEGFSLREPALAHAESCDGCGRLMTEIESLEAGLRAIAAGLERRQAPAHVETALLAEFRRQKLARTRWSVQRQVAALSTAAAALLVVGFSLHHFLLVRSGANQPKPVSAVNQSAVPAVQSANSESDTEESEYASFVPLPYADDPSALDDGTVVRVEMPRAALASFGLPVAAMEGDGTVRADLIVSADGTPQAIRLVSPDSTSQE
jgi:hypothetical protein